MGSFQSGESTATRPAVRVALTYLLFGFIWLVVSDFFLHYLDQQTFIGYLLAVGKGMIFVSLSSWLILRLIRHELKALAESASLLNGIIESTTDSVFLKDLNGKYLIFNRAAALTSGRPASEIIGKDGFAFLNEADARTVIENDREAIRLGRIVERQELTLDGNRKTYLTTKSSYLDADGRIIGVLGTATDITELENERRLLQESEEKFRRLVEASSSMIWTADAAGMAFEDSPSMREFTGSSSEFWLDMVHPEDRDRLAEAWQRAVETKSLHKAEFRMRSRTGEYREFDVRAVPLLDAAGKVRLWIGACTDITERKQFERALRESDARLKLALTAAGMGVWEWDIESGVVLRSLETLAMAGNLKKSGTYDEFRDIVHPADVDRFEEAFHRGLTEKTRIHLEFRIVRRDGSVIWVENIAEVFTKPGGGTRVIGTMRDVNERYLNEAALREERDKFAQIAATVPGIVYSFVLRPDGTSYFPYLSPRSVELFGLHLEEVQEESSAAFALVHPDELHRLNAAIDDSRNQLTEFRIELRVLSRTMGEIWVEAYSLPQRLPNGSVLWYGTFTDVTFRKHAEQALMESEARFRLFVDNALDAFFLHDSAGRIIDVNNLACESLGYTRDELIGMHPLDIDPDLTMARFLELKTVLGSGATSTFQTRHRRKDGVTYPVEMRLRMILLSGKTQVVALATDISERLRIERELREREERYRAVVETTSDGFITVDTSGNILEVNESYQRLSGFSRDELRAMNIASLHPREEGFDFASHINQIREHGAEVYETLHRRKDGVVWPAEIHASYWRGGLFFAFVHDITERVRAREAIRESEQRFRAFMDYSPFSSWVTDSERRLLFANRKLVEILGKSPAEMVNKKSEELFPAEIDDSLKSGHEAVLTSNIAGERSQRFLRAYGGVGEALVVEFPIPQGDCVLVGVVAVDITELRKAEERLRVLGAAIESSPNAVYIADRDGVIRWVSPAFSALSGYSFEEVVGLSPRILKSGVQGDEFYESLWNTVLAGRVWSGELVEKHKDGGEYIVRQTITPLAGPDGAIAQFVAVQENVTDRKKAEAKLRDMAVTDPLTGLLNRAGLRERLAALLPSEPIALHFLDLDRFKFVNDAHGHHAGDELLKQVADRLLRRVRGSDVVARFGGDEFVIIQIGMRSPDDASALAHGLIAAFDKPFLASGEEFKLGVSVGIALSRREGEDADLLIRNADMAMYRAKQEGRGTFRFFNQSIEEKVLERITLESEIRRAIELGEFELHYQPQVMVVDGFVCGAEALIRWRHAKRGMVSPGAFLPVAEETGLILPMSEWVLHEACREGKRRLDAGRPLRLAVNVSVAQVQRGNLVGSVNAALRETGLPADLLELEITEGLLLPDVPEAGQVLQELHGMGVGLAIDDFGTGFSSLSYLGRMPVDVLKIDRSFVSRVPGAAKDMSLIRAIIGMGHDLGLRIVAEGVETKEQLAFLQSEGCDMAQGYYFGRPTHPKDFPTQPHLG